MTFNVFFLNQNISALEEIIEKGDADIVALQELTEDQANQLAPRLKSNYPYSSMALGQGYSSIATFSKYPIKSSPPIPTKEGYSHLLFLKHPKREIALVNIHTESINPINVFGNGGEISRAYLDREEMLRAIFVQLKENSISAENTLLMGDFNSTEGNKLYNLIKREGYTDSYRAVNAILPHSFTFPKNTIGLFRKDSEFMPLLRIDYVYSGSGFKPLKGEVIQADSGSDHRPLLVSLELI